MSPFRSCQRVALSCLSIRRQRMWVLTLYFVIFGCATSPANKLYTYADKYGFSTTVINSQTHNTVVFKNTHTTTAAAHLHVYLEGDGTPWVQGRVPATDPSPRNPIALKLMALDPAPSVYLNRPCYGQTKVDKRCNDNKLWTSARYGKEVLNTINDALNHFKSSGTKSFSIFGYSGGANIAIQLAAMREDIKHVITIAGNLDHKAWTQHFQYLPLKDSANAVDFFPLKSAVVRKHLFGGKDTVIPFHIAMASAKNDIGASVQTYETFDHTCCWEKVWLDILSDIQP